jgi:hypothetical protein
MTCTCKRAREEIASILLTCGSPAQRIETIWGYVVSHTLPPTRRLSKTSILNADGKCLLSETVEEGDHIFIYSLYWQMVDGWLTGRLLMVETYADATDESDSQTRLFDSIDEFENYLMSEVL